MSRKHKVHSLVNPYFITMTIESWIPIFNNPNILNIAIASIIHCQSEKGLEIYAYCIMPSHIHMVCRATKESLLSYIIRDFKKFTSKKITKYLNDNADTRNLHILAVFSSQRNKKKSDQNYSVWQEGFQPIELTSNYFIDQKINYIHANPVTAGFVKRPQDYKLSSARNYAEMESLIEVVVSHGRWTTY